MKKKTIIFAIIGVLLIATLYNTKVFAKYVIDAKIIAAKLNIDRTKPEGIVNYSTSEMTNESVIVTIILNEPIESVEGWQISEDKIELTKIYQENTTENIRIVDMSGNDNSIEIDIQNINME